MKIMLISLLFLATHMAFADSSAATDVAQTARVKINSYLLAFGLAGSFPGVEVPTGQDACNLTEDALAGFGMLHGKTDVEIAQILAFPGIQAANIDSVIDLLNQAEVNCK